MDAGRGAGDLAAWLAHAGIRSCKHIRDGTGRQALVMRYPLRSRLRGAVSSANGALTDAKLFIARHTLVK
ncbi:hypothetical protein VNPA120661_50880 [Pseudomonas aeruginosa]|nr:hypothetical protein RVB2_48760 [Pseudomonas aeruginosa]GLE71791.1 hypothetical protein VNPA110517_56330 [Pseudomonas aeruginosa]GLE84764.1 hypothetical protein VNPA120661_50880 [Pseudomonas aeruginosa]GLE97928.1 hypothetical protein VNPA120840_47790 [Pseudomonas aeruginosa]GLF04871.1 hypothetical protein VNPA120889_50280 [Pseudomonas aeruginosa]